MVQFVMELPNAAKVPVTALVDTGAEINLIRRDLVPAEAFRRAEKPITFVAANQMLVSGGQQEFETTLVVQGVDPDLGSPSSLRLPIVCYDADIGVDLILSYEWMAAMKMDVIPRRHGLLVQADGYALWVPGVRETSQRVPTKISLASQCAIAKATFSEDIWVQPKYFSEIVHQFGLRPTLDVFGTPETSVCSRWSNPPGEVGDHASTGSEEVLWLHPPPAEGPEVEAIIARTSCAAIVICPAWEKPWIHRLLDLCSARIYFEKGVQVFGSKDSPLRETPLPVWPLKFDSGPRRSTFSPIIAHFPFGSSSRKGGDSLEGLPPPRSKILSVKGPKPEKMRRFCHVLAHLACWTCSPGRVRWAKCSRSMAMK